MAYRLGAYVLPGDPVWLEQTLAQYYPLLDDLVVPVPAGSRGWSGTVLPVKECLDIIRRVDVRCLARELHGSWTNQHHPIEADTAQRQDALNAMCGRVDWVLQLDNDEFLPRPEIVAELIDLAERSGLDAIEAPMRVLFRRTRRSVFEVRGRRGLPHHEYPGAILIRPSVRLANARQVAGVYGRLVAAGAESSLQLKNPPSDAEVRLDGFSTADAIVHNSWARSPAEVRAKVASWGHSDDANFDRYYWLRWWPTPLLWWANRDFHPFIRGLWPRLRKINNDGIVGDRPRTQSSQTAAGIQSPPVATLKRAGGVVVVLSWFGKDDTLACVESLVTWSPDANVLVIDNGSRDGVLEAVQDRWSEVHTLQTGENLGFAGGMNAGIRWATAHGAHHITVLNNDTVVPPGAIAALELASGEDRAVSPEVRYLDAPERIWFGAGEIAPRTVLPQHIHESRLAPGNPLRPSEVLAGCCVTASAAVWQRAGLFDQRFFLNFEDSEWSVRAAAAGVALAVDPRVSISHRVSASFKRNASLLGTYYYARNGLLFNRLMGGTIRSRYRFLRAHALPSLRVGLSHGQLRQLMRTLIVIGFAVCNYLTGQTGRAPRPVEQMIMNWGRRARPVRPRRVGHVNPPPTSA